MKSIRLLFVLLASAAILFTGCSKDDDLIAVSNVTLNEATLDLKPGETFTLTATVTPDDAENKTVSWSSSAPAVATVDAATGLVTAVAMGEAAITATAGGKTAECIVTVSVALEYAITINNETGSFGGHAIVDNVGVPVTLSYRTHGGTGTATSTDLTIGNSDTSGKVIVSGELEDKTPRVIEFSTDNYTTSTLITFGTVPAGFLTNKTADRMSQAEARAFAAYHGGRLPLVGGKTVYKWSEYTAAMHSTTVDGFGIYNVSDWPADVPTVGSIWTDTEDTEYDDGTYWVISHSGDGKVAPGGTWDTPNDTWWVICLP